MHVYPNEKTFKPHRYAFFGWFSLCLADGVDAAKEESGSTSMYLERLRTGFKISVIVS